MYARLQLTMTVTSLRSCVDTGESSGVLGLLLLPLLLPALLSSLLPLPLAPAALTLLLQQQEEGTASAPCIRRGFPGRRICGPVQWLQ